ncbi:hypothetical protein [Nautilia sp.]
MIAVIIESALKGSQEKNHLVRILGLNEVEAKKNEYIDMKGRTVVFYQMGGKGELLKKEKYEAIIQKTEKLFFVLDADEDFELTKNEIEKLISVLNVSADYFINCDPEIKKGNLETLLLKCVKEELKSCYSDFLVCLGKQKLEKYTEKNILKKLFEIKNPPYNLECVFFDKLKNKFYSL